MNWQKMSKLVGLHVRLLGDLEVLDRLSDIVEEGSGACVRDSPTLHVAPDASLGEGHATGAVCGRGRERVSAEGGGRGGRGRGGERCVGKIYV